MPDKELTFAERYERGEIPWDSGTPSHELCRVLDAGGLPGITVLEIGCGTGTNAIEFARRGYQVLAVDFVPQAIDAARAKARAAKVEVTFRVADLLNDDLGGPFDILFDRGVYHCVRRNDLAGFQKFLLKTTRPGSWWLSLTGNANEPSEGEGPPVVSEAEIRAELEPLFEIVVLKEFRFVSKRPEFHPLAWSILMRHR